MSTPHERKVARIEKLLAANSRADGTPKRGCSSRVAALRAELEQLTSEATHNG